MWDFFKNWLGYGRPVAPQVDAPYKVETPVVEVKEPAPVAETKPTPKPKAPRKTKPKVV